MHNGAGWKVSVSSSGAEYASEIFKDQYGKRRDVEDKVSRQLDRSVGEGQAWGRP